MPLTFRSTLRSALALALPLGAVAALSFNTAASASSDGASWPTIAKQASIAAEVPSAITSSGNLTVASDATYAPMEYIASDGSTVVGVDVDFMKAISQVLGLKLQMSNVTFDSIIPKLQTGAYDVGASSFTDTKSREKVVNFVNYFQAGESFYEAKGTKALSGTGLTQICGLTVAVELGTQEQSDAQAANSLCTKAKKAGVTVLTYNTQTLANAAVASGNAKIGFADSEVTNYIVASSKGTFVNTGKVYGTAPYGFAVVKGGANAKLDKAILDATNYIIKHGQYGTIIKYWGQSAGKLSAATLNKAIS